MINLEHVKEFGYNILGPIASEYTRWVLYQANELNIKTLYFLARDGYIFYNIANILNEILGYDIEFRYLYCSRRSLRMPTYHFIGEEAYDLLSLWGYHISRYSILKRLDLNKVERESVYKELSIDIKDEKQILSSQEYRKFTESLRKSETYREFILNKSKAEYENIIGYLKQEKVFSQESFAIVDSGWSGSMQRSFRQLLRHAGYKGDIMGFYFGLYNLPKSDEDGKYFSFYFDALHNKARKIFFDNKIFECILSAPHGMTVSYLYEDSIYKPLLHEDLNKQISQDIVRTQIESALEYVRDNRKYIIYNKKISPKRVYKLLKSFMTKPDLKYVDIYSNFNFCDDISEAYKKQVIDKNELNKIKQNMFFYRVLAKIKKTNTMMDEIMWPYGATVYIDKRIRWWYRWNIYLYEYIKHSLLTLKERRKNRL